MTQEHVGECDDRTPPDEIASYKIPEADMASLGCILMLAVWKDSREAYRRFFELLYQAADRAHPTDEKLLLQFIEAFHPKG